MLITSPIEVKFRLKFAHDDRIRLVLRGRPILPAFYRKMHVFFQKFRHFTELRFQPVWSSLGNSVLLVLESPNTILGIHV